MMGRKWIIAGFLSFGMFCAMSASGQRPIEFGVKAGINTENIDIVHPSSGAFILSTDAKVGYQVGIMSRVNLAMFHIQPELLYNMHRYSMYATAKDSDERTKSDVRINTMEVPVLLGMRLLMLRVNAGPVFNVMTDTSVKNGSAGHSVMTTRPSVSYMLGVGLDLGKLNLDVRYNGQFSRSEQSILIPSTDPQGKDYKVKIRTWMFSIGYMF